MFQLQERFVLSNEILIREKTELQSRQELEKFRCCRKLENLTLINLEEEETEQRLKIINSFLI
jgi:hypothetical protein